MNLERIIEKIESYKSFPYNWDGKRAKELDRTVLELTKKIVMCGRDTLDSLSPDEEVISCIVKPCSDGSIDLNLILRKESGYAGSFYGKNYSIKIKEDKFPHEN